MPVRWGLAGIKVSTATGRWGSRGHLPARQDNRYVDDSSVELCLVHVRNGSFCISLMGVQDVGTAAVEASMFANGKIHILDLAVLTKDLTQVVLVHVLGEFLNDNLGASGRAPRNAAAPGSAP